MKNMVLIVTFITIIIGCVTNDSSDDGSKTNSDVVQAIGRGYDVFGNYADPEYLKGSILDYQALIDNSQIEKIMLEKGDFTSSSGKTFSEYSNSLNIKTNISGNYKFYSGSMKTNFTTDRFNSSQYQFATVHSDIKKYSLTIKNEDKVNYSNLKKYLTQTFKERINDSTDDCYEIFNTYGTHVLTGIIMGARLDYSLSAQTTASTGSETIENYAKASYKSLFSSASLSVDVKTSSYWSERFESTEVRTFVIGGKSEYGQHINNDGDYTKWIDSINDNTVFSNITADGIVPVWELTDNTVKKELLKKAFERWATERELNFTPEAIAKTCIVDILVRDSGANDYIDYNGGKYYRINQDLNEGAGGDDIYIYVRYGKDDGSDGYIPITHIGVVHDADENDAIYDNPDHYTRINFDLNRDAGGDYMYLCYYRSTIYKPIRNLYVYNHSDNTREFTSIYKKPDLSYYQVKRLNDKNWTSEYPDLNRKAGGDYIYLFYSDNMVD
ncbi:MAG: hypothetical protein A2015_07365 [Spirochaetes bacterium GWF1_31_7]|nr:MAG: hypothetical protein A2Y30_02740 [Spirochaetes bacterium GWE1_32_154]OHD47576.1 MAG: hypothetical protein A2Y29_00185 [Spirochaetes bacterium GWE2_31_10]OHD51236.1 MAG: hypothetical protein A2015_07365 [Spirochaetes bacterium GWF1_31_7]OHD80973.1 MAG: hypothetical protein A2355_06220 [Spirochaetes bacterium RIFOXYB1_FULL_32_8]HBD96133.1 hypothetical protein [Spirochaetia bacterium]